MMVAECVALFEWRFAGKPKYLARNPAWCYLVHHKSHMDCPGIEPSPPTGYKDSACNRPLPYRVLSRPFQRARFIERHIICVHQVLLGWWSQGECDGGRVALMGETRNAYKSLVGKPEGTRPRGRPGRRWEDNIRIDIREVGWEGVHWMHLS
jgi:hypothetical protein